MHPTICLPFKKKSPMGTLRLEKTKLNSFTDYSMRPGFFYFYNNIFFLSQGHTEKNTCLKDIKEHVTSVIGRNLKYWRQIEDRELKEALFKRLQHLHTLALDLSLFHVTDLSSNSVKQTSLSNTLSILAKNWDIDSVLRKNAKVTSLRKRS